MDRWIATTTAIAAKLGTTTRRVQQLIKELEIVPVQTIGRSMILSDADVKRLQKRNTKRGPVKNRNRRTPERS